MAAHDNHTWQLSRETMELAVCLVDATVVFMVSSDAGSLAHEAEVLEQRLLEWAESDQTTDAPQNVVLALEDQIPESIRALIRNNLLDKAHQVATILLRLRIVDGDADLAAVGLLLRHYRILIARQPPLSHVDTVALHPNRHLYECFDRFIDLIGRQSRQIIEMSAIISELT